MKKIYLFIVFALMAITASAQEPLYTFETTVTNNASWGEDWAPYFVLQDTKVTVEVYEEDYVIIRNWGGTEGNDLKVEYDPSIDTEAEDCLGNVISAVNIYDGEEDEPVIYQGFNYTYTGRDDEYAVCATYINQDGTLYWSFVNVDKENKTGNVLLSGYYCDPEYSSYSAYNLYYYVEWEGNEPLYTVNSKISNVESWGDDYASYFAFKGTEVNIEVYEDNYVIIKNWAGAEGCDLKLEIDPNIVVDENNDGNIISVTNIIDGKEVEPVTYEYNGYTYCDFQTGREDWGILSTTLNEDATVTYSWVEYDNEIQAGYIMLTGYFMTSDYSSYNANEYYYYVEWTSENVSGINSVTANTNNSDAIYNLSGMRVNDSYKGIVIKNGKKYMQSGK